MGSKKAEVSSILQADKKLSEAEKQRAAAQVRLKQLEQQHKAEEERRKQLELQMRDLKRSHQENIRQMEAKMKEEAENLKQESERALQCKLREQEKLLEQGFKEKAKLLKEEMEQLKKEAKEREEKLLQELSQKSAEEEHKERQWDREEKEWQRKCEERQWEREEKERQRQWEREEKERQRQWEREEKERQRQHEERKWEREEKEREAKERERRYQHELKMWRRKAELVPEQFMENKMEEAATNLTAACSLTGEAERRTAGEGERKLSGKKADMETKTKNDPNKQVPPIVTAGEGERKLGVMKGETDTKPEKDPKKKVPAIITEGEDERKLGGKKAKMDMKTEKDPNKKVPVIVTGRSRPQTMAPEWRMEQPVCLIESDNKGSLQVNPKAVKILEAIAQPVVVVAVVGLYRTGKSYLLNALAGQRKGFSLGSTVQSHTKGIWMWCLPHPCWAGHALVLLDTEGLGDAHKGDPKHDNWIFTLAVLLSSTLVYNSKGTIDQDAVSKLHYVSELSKYIKVKADEAEEEEEEIAADTTYVSFFPSFIWTLRDFSLELELGGKQVTEDEYLESTLILKKGQSMDVLSYNLPRQCIREYFPTRKCFVFLQPASDRNLKQLESLPDSALQPEFLEQSRRFCQYVLQESRVKMLKGGHPVTGQMLGLLAQSYVETIVSGKVPCLEDAVTSIAAKQNEAAVREGLALYDAQMEEQVTFPAEVAALSETHGACERAALQLFMQQSFKDEGQKYQEQLATAINEHYRAVLGRNQTASQETCWALLSQLSADVERKLSEGVYMQPGGYQVYVTDQRQVLESFQRAPNKGVMAEQVLQQFMDSKKTEAASILRSNKKLSEAEKNQAADQARLEQLEQKRKAEEERRQQLEQQRRDLKRSHQENINQVEAKMKEDAEKLKQEMEAALQSKLREQEKLLEQGFKEKAKLLKEEMEQLRKEAKERKEKQQQELNQKRAEEQLKWEKEENVLRHQWEREENKRDKYAKQECILS